MKIFMLTSSLFLLVSFAQAKGIQHNKSICGKVDDRVPSSDPKVARLVQAQGDGGCTATMIGRHCAITAGHCKSVMVLAEFNTPMSQQGKAQASTPEDLYEIDQDSIKFNNGGRGADWAVFKIKKNLITDQYPGDVQGNYEVGPFVLPSVGEALRITGHGVDFADPEKHLAQQTHSGLVTPTSKYDKASVLNYRVDTTGGNSGSSVIMESTNEIIGIHTHGGCRSSDGFGQPSANSGTAIAEVPELQAAIAACLADDLNL